MAMRRILACILAFGVAPSGANACATHSVAQVADAIKNSSYGDQTLKSTACTWGGAAVAESGGNSCSSNGNNFGVLQLTRSNLPAGMSPQAYMSLPLQQQVDIWIKQAGPTKQGASFDFLNSNIGSSVGGQTITPGMAAACTQFGALICGKNLAALRATGSCQTMGNGGVRATGATLRDRTANLDGNGQSICSWGKVIQAKIDKSGCTSPACTSTTPDAPTSPAPADSSTIKVA